MKRTAALLIIITLFSKVLGFAREIVLAYFYGATNISDAYFISLSIPFTVFAFIGVAISTSFIPMYSNIQKESSIIKADQFTSNIINLAVVFSFLLSFLSLFFAIPIVKLFASGFKGSTLNLAVFFTRISVIGIVFSSLVYVFIGYLQIKNNFVAPALIGVPYNLVIILSIIFSYNMHLIILPLGNVFGVVSQLLLIISYVYKNNFRYSLFLNINDKNVKKMIKLILPVIIGLSVEQINKLVDRTIASQIAVGGISALTYANRLNWFIQGIFVMSIATVIYPMISKMVAENNMFGFKKSLYEAIISINLLVVPATVGAMIFAEPVVRLLFGRGAFGSQAIYMTSYALFFYSIGMIGFGLREVLSRAFYSLQDTKTPMINAAVAMVMNIILNMILSRYLGIGGLALATSISAIFCTILLFISLRKKIGLFGMKNIIISFIKILCASLVMGLLAKVSYDILLIYINGNLSLVLSIGIGVAIYFIIIYFMKIEEVDTIVNAIKRKMKVL